MIKRSDNTQNVVLSGIAEMSKLNLLAPSPCAGTRKLSRLRAKAVKQACRSIVLAAHLRD